ncbi:MAG: calcium-binding protein, partial [Gemmataceae bacterium]
EGGGGNTFRIDDPAARDYTSITTGTGDDVVHVVATTTDVYSVNFGGRDTFTVGDGSLAAVRANVLVGDDGAGLTDLIVDNSGEAAAHAIVFGPSSPAMAALGATASITGASLGEIALYGTLASVTIRGGARDTFTQLADYGVPVVFEDGTRVTATLDAADGVLRVEGTSRDDGINVVQAGDGTVRVEGVTIRYVDGQTVTEVSSVPEWQVLYVEVWARAGADTVRNQTAKPSTLVGGVGDDTMYGGDGKDDMYGEGDNDTLYGSPRGEEGVELGADSGDVLWGGEGHDHLWGGYGNDSLVGGNGNDVLHGQWGNDWVVGSNWDKVNHRPVAAEVGECRDILFGGNGADKIYGGDGDDDLSGGWDSDELHGGDGNDNLWGAYWNDPEERTGFVNDDTLYGGAGDDYLSGGVGYDNLYGGAGADTLDGGAGNDGLFGGWGEVDTLIGGTGADRFLQVSYVGSLTSEDVIQDRRVEDVTIDFRDTLADAGVVLNGVAYDPANGMPLHSFAAGTWTDAEIEGIDVALGNLHRHTRNTRLLKTANQGKGLTFERIGAQLNRPDFLAAAWNDGGKIVMVGGAPLASDLDLWTTVYHEVGHNWDEEGENARIGAFREISQWRESATQPTTGHMMSEGAGDDWWCLSDPALYARPVNAAGRSYSRQNPLEDYATTWETYFAEAYHGTTNGNNRVQAKYDDLDLLFAGLR